MKHTKGLFTEVPFHNGTHVFSETGKKIASFWHVLFTNEEHEANVKLFKAAPEMYDLLKSMNIIFHGYKNLDKETIGHKALVKYRNIMKQLKE